MNFELKSFGLVGAGAEKCDALLVLVPQSFKAEKNGLSMLISQAIKSSDFDTKPGKYLSMYRPSQAEAVRVVMVGIGEGRDRDIRTAIHTAWGAIKAPSVEKVAVCFAQAAKVESIRSAVLAMADATYVYTATKSKPEGRAVQKVIIAAQNATEVQEVFQRAVATVIGVEVAKEWANKPANHATPTHLAQAALEIGKSPKMRCEVLGPKEVTKLNMGSFLAVAQGSEQPLRFIVLSYDGAAKSRAPTVLVGKGITFDSGGISIKPAPEMDEMKFDMAGAASVLGVFRTLALLKPSINVVGLIPACENLLSGRAVKPGDVVSSMSGQTIEILNTDAEGRLVLCDALTYAERFSPAAVIDIATLTGACMIALGGVRSGLFAAQEELGTALMAAADASQDLCWRMPLDEDYGEGLKTNFADVANVAGRAGGAITAAKFLQRFSTKFAWAHLDIAGTAWKSGLQKGATGRPVGLLVEYLMSTVENK
jgi:leucyl aminopeptidase